MVLPRVCGREVRGMVESVAVKEEQHQAEGLSLKELEGQIVELLPNRIEMRRHRRRNIIVNNISKCNGDLINLNVIASQCN
jgi:hypothetical protein